MRSCPCCGASLQAPPQRERKRTDAEPGRKNTGHELIHCPDCERVIDGFTAH